MFISIFLFGAAALWRPSAGAPHGNSSIIVNYHDLNNNLVSTRPLTGEELELYKQSSLVNDIHQDLGTRSSRDLIFWLWEAPYCYADTCNYTWDVEVAQTGTELCNAARTFGNTEYKQAACWSSGLYGGNWYFLDNCDPNFKDWAVATPGDYVAVLRTWNNVYVGNCYATGHSTKYDDCGSNDTWESLIRCNVP